MRLESSAAHSTVKATKCELTTRLSGKGHKVGLKL